MSAYEELDGSPIENQDGDKFSAVRKLKCTWDTRVTLANQLAGTTYPFITNSRAVAKRITIEPFGKIGGVKNPIRDRGNDPGASFAHYDYAILTVGYETPTDTSAGLVYVGGIEVQESVEPTVEFITLDPTSFSWTGNVALTADEAPGFQIRGFDWLYRQIGRKSLPVAVLDLIGKVNQAAMVSPSLGLIFAAETILFNPPTIERVGINMFNVSYRFSVRWSGWNKFWRVATGTYEYMYKNGVIYRPYPLGNFSGI